MASSDGPKAAPCATSLLVRKYRHTSGCSAHTCQCSTRLSTHQYPSEYSHLQHPKPQMTHECLRRRAGGREGLRSLGALRADRLGPEERSRALYSPSCDSLG
jgi:hypothetical protein